MLFSLDDPTLYFIIILLKNTIHILTLTKTVYMKRLFYFTTIFSKLNKNVLLKMMIPGRD